MTHLSMKTVLLSAAAAALALLALIAAVGYFALQYTLGRPAETADPALA